LLSAEVPIESKHDDLKAVVICPNHFNRMKMWKISPEGSPSSYRINFAGAIQNHKLTQWNATAKSWVSRYLNRSYLGKWVTIGILIGLVAGFGATAFYFMIQAVSNYLLGGINGFYPPNPAGEPPAPAIVNPRYFLIPVATAIDGLVAGPIIYRFAPEAEGHGTDAAILAFHNKGGYIRRRIPVVKTIASAFTIGSGGSAGRERGRPLRLRRVLALS